MKKEFKKAFTLIEMMVVIFIIGVIVYLSIISFTNTEEISRNTARINDIKQIQLSLEEYYKYESSYPDTLNFGGPLKSPSNNKIILAMTPKNPIPRDDGSCPDEEYQYSYDAENKTYTLTFCISDETLDLDGGTYQAVPSGIIKIE